MTATEFISKRQFDLNAIVFIVSMAVALRYNRESIVIRNVGYVIDLFWIALAAITLLRGRNRISGNSSDYKPIALRLMLPKILIWTYGIVLVIVGQADIEAFSTGFTVLATFVLPISALYLFKSKTIDYVFWANLITFLFEVFMILMQSVRCMEMPLPRVTKPMISSPGTGLQHFEKRTERSWMPFTVIPDFLRVCAGLFSDLFFSEISMRAS